jgi:hypothetical protein
VKHTLFVVALLGADLSAAGASWAQSDSWGGTAGVAAMRGYTASSGMGLPADPAAPRLAGPAASEAVATVTPGPAPLLRRVARRSTPGRGGRWNHRPHARLL